MQEIETKVREAMAKRAKEARVNSRPVAQPAAVVSVQPVKAEAKPAKNSAARAKIDITVDDE